MLGLRRKRPLSECGDSSQNVPRHNGMVLQSQEVNNADKACIQGRPDDVPKRSLRKRAFSRSREPKKEINESKDSRITKEENSGKRSSRVLAAVAAFNERSKPLPTVPLKQDPSDLIDPAAIAFAFENLLDKRNVPDNTREKMRSLDTNIKADLLRQEKAGSRPGTSAGAQDSELGCSAQEGDRSSLDHEAGRSRNRSASGQSTSSKKTRPRSLSRPKSLTFSFSKSDLSPSKKAKSENHQRTKSIDIPRPTSSRSSSRTNLVSGLPSPGNRDKAILPEHFIEYLKRVQRPQVVEVGKIQKLRQVLRNETVSWVEGFVSEKGMTEIIQLLYRVMEVEWREEHEDNLLHELLLCLKALSTTSPAMRELSAVQSTLFPKLIGMLFDEEKKGPSEYSTRMHIITLLFNYLTYSQSLSHADRATVLISYLRDPSPPEANQPPGFISSIYHPRPFRTWNKELTNLTKEVFWIFLHHTNIIPYPSESDAHGSLNSNLSTYQTRHYPTPHPPVPAAPYIGGVEWDATTYVTAHLDLLNGLLASLPTREERTALRQQLRDSGFEKLMGTSLRTCKEKLYGSVHEALSVWIGAAREDGWPVKDIKEGPPREDTVRSPRKAPGASPKKAKGKEDVAPKLDMPKLELGITPGPTLGEKNSNFLASGEDGGWF